MKKHQFENALRLLAFEIKNWLKIFEKHSKIVPKVEERHIIIKNKMESLLTLIPVDDKDISIENFHQNKQIDTLKNIESEIDIDKEYLPILLRDPNGYLYFYELGSGRYDNKENAKSLGNGTMEVIREYYVDIVLFTLKGNPIFAKRRVGYEKIVVKEGKDGIPDYDESNASDFISKIVQDTKEEIVEVDDNEDGIVDREVLERRKIYTKSYSEEKETDKKENCIGHTVTTSKENIWINPNAFSEKIGIDFQNVRAMILDSGYSLVQGGESKAKSGDLIVFKATTKLIEKEINLQKEKVKVGDFIHAAIYNGDGTYSSKNGEKILSEKESLQHLIELYDNDYDFYTIENSKNINPIKWATIMGDIKVVKMPGYNEILFTGRKISFTEKELKGLTEKEIIELASNEIKKLIQIDEEVPELIQTIKDAFKNAEICLE